MLATIKWARWMGIIGEGRDQAEVVQPGEALIDDYRAGYMIEAIEIDIPDSWTYGETQCGELGLFGDGGELLYVGVVKGGKVVLVTDAQYGTQRLAAKAVSRRPVPVA